MEIKSPKSAGSLKISENVVVKTAVLAASEVEGVALDGGGIIARESRYNTVRFPVRAEPLYPVKVRLTNEAAEIDISIVALQGRKAVVVAETVQHAVKSAVQNMTGIAVSKVNVKIAGIRFKNEE